MGAGFYEYEKDYVFATVETLNRDTHLFQYQPNAFDCIILDEAHHSSNNIYTKVINYFNPKLFLGMTATPDKMCIRDRSTKVWHQQAIPYPVA